MIATFILASCNQFSLIEINNWSQLITKRHLVRKVEDYNANYPHESTKNQIKSSSYSRYHAEARNDWRDRSPRLSAWGRPIRKTITAVGNLRRQCVPFNLLRNRTPDSCIVSGLIVALAGRYVQNKLMLFLCKYKARRCRQCLCAISDKVKATFRLQVI